MLIQDFIIRIVTAIVLGLIIGLERQLTGHVAGIKTTILISLGSCLFVIFGLFVPDSDQTRIAGQVVTGCGFLCSGVIFKNSENVNGLNTAATIWCTSAIGVLCSLGKIIFPVAAAGLLVFSNVIFYSIAAKVPVLKGYENNDEQTFELHCTGKEIYQTIIKKKVLKELNEQNLLLCSIDYNSKDGIINYKFILKYDPNVKTKKLNNLINNLVGEDELLTVDLKYNLS